MRTAHVSGTTRPVDRLSRRFMAQSRCTISGIYETDCGDRLRVVLYKGERFPDCPDHDHVAWQLAEEVEV